MLYYSCWCSLFGWVITCFLFFCFVFVASKIFFSLLVVESWGTNKKKNENLEITEKKKNTITFFYYFSKIVLVGKNLADIERSDKLAPFSLLCLAFIDTQIGSCWVFFFQ